MRNWNVFQIFVLSSPYQPTAPHQAMVHVTQRTSQRTTRGWGSLMTIRGFTTPPIYGTLEEAHLVPSRYISTPSSKLVSTQSGFSTCLRDLPRRLGARKTAVAWRLDQGRRSTHGVVSTYLTSGASFLDTYLHKGAACLAHHVAYDSPRVLPEAGCCASPWIGLHPLPVGRAFAFESSDAGRRFSASWPAS